MTHGDWRDTAQPDYCPVCKGHGLSYPYPYTNRLGLQQYVLPDGASITGCARCGWRTP